MVEQAIPVYELRTRKTVRSYLDAILYRMRTRCRWVDLPAKFPHEVAFRKVPKDWKKEETMHRILETLRTGKPQPVKSEKRRYDFLPDCDLSDKQ